MDCAAIYHGDTYKSQLKKYFIRFLFFFLNHVDLFWLHSLYNRQSRISPSSLSSIEQLQHIWQKSFTASNLQPDRSWGWLSICGFKPKSSTGLVMTFISLAPAWYHLDLLSHFHGGSINSCDDTDMMSCMIPSGHCRLMIFPSSNLQLQRTKIKIKKKKNKKSSEETNNVSFLAMSN